MSRFDEVLKELQSRVIKQTNDWEEDLYDLVQPYEIIEEGLNVDKHRWYELSTTVIEIEDRLLGIVVVSTTYGEDIDLGDVNHEYIFFEMEAVPSITYTKKV